MLKKKIAQRDALLARCLELKPKFEDGSLTEAELTEFRSATDQAAQLRTEIAEMEKLVRAHEAEAAQRSSTLDEPGTQARGAAPAAPGHVSNPKDLAEDKPFESFGHQLLAIRAAGENPVEIDPRLRKYDVRLGNVRSAAGLNESVASEGGFLVTQDVGPLLTKGAQDASQVWSKADSYTLSSSANSMKFPTVDETSRATGSRWGGIQVYWNSEAGTLTDSKPKFGEIQMSLKKLTGLCYASDEQLQDASILDQIITRAFSEEFAFVLDDAAIRGTGAGQPLGILNSPALVTISKETSQAANTILYPNVSKMRAAMLPRSYANAVWFVNSECMPQIEQLSVPIKNVAGSENVGGLPVFVNGNATNRPFDSLLGRPIVPIEQASALSVLGDIMLVDMGMYATLSKGGMQTASSIHVKFLTDEMAFRFILRVDGQPKLKSAITPYKGSISKSAFVTLQAR